MRSRDKTSILFSTLFLVLTAIGVIAWELIALPYSDDWFYLFAYSNYPFVGSLTASMQPIASLGDVWDSFSAHYIYFNCRLSHLLMYLTDLLPQPVTDVINGLMIMAMLMLIVIAARGRSGLKSPLTVTLTATLMWLLMPWHDNLVSIDFQINYVWSSVIVLLFIHIFFNHPQRISGWRWAWAIPIAVAAGWMHEGIAIPVAVGTLWTVIIDRSPARRNRIALFACFCAGICLNLGPGTLDRILYRNEIPLNLMAYRWFVSRAVLGMLPLLAPVAATTALSYAKGTTAAKSFILANLPWIIIAVTSLLIGCAVMRLDRSLWMMDISAIVLTIKAICALKVSRGAGRWIAGILAAVNLLFLFGLCHWQRIMATDQQMMIDLRRAEGVRELYTALPMADESPWYTLGIPRRYNATNRLDQYTFSAALDSGNIAMYPVLPLSCKGKPFEQWPKIPGDNPFRGEYPALYATDSLSYMLDIHVAEPLPSMPPINRLLMLINGKSMATLVPADPATLWDGDSGAIYQYPLYRLPRTIQNRRLVRIDVMR